MLKEINDTALENYKNRLVSDMHLFSSVPNMTDNAFASNLSGVAISYKMWSMDQVVAIKERKFKKIATKKDRIDYQYFEFYSAAIMTIEISMSYLIEIDLKTS